MLNGIWDIDLISKQFIYANRKKRVLIRTIAKILSSIVMSIVSSKFFENESMSKHKIVLPKLVKDVFNIMYHYSKRSKSNKLNNWYV